MPTPARSVVAALAGAATLALVSTPAGQAAGSEYATPKTGKWKVQNIFEATTGGGAEVYAKGTRLRNLTLSLGEDTASRCDGLTGSLKVIGALKIARVGSYQRPAVGRLSSATKLIDPISARVKVNGGASEAAKVIVLFEKTGKAALTARVEFGECKVSFALRK